MGAMTKALGHNAVEPWAALLVSFGPTKNGAPPRLIISNSIDRENRLKAPELAAYRLPADAGYKYALGCDPRFTTSASLPSVFFLCFFSLTQSRPVHCKISDSKLLKGLDLSIVLGRTT